MRRRRLAAAGVLLLVVTEIALLAVVGRAIGFGPLMLVLLVEGVVAGVLIRLAGRRAWASLTAAGRDPEHRGPELSDAGLVLLGAILLAMPGFLSDAAGLLVLLPPTRGLARRGLGALGRAATRRYRDQADLLAARLDRDSVVEGHAVEEPAPPNRPRPDDPTVIRGEIAD